MRVTSGGRARATPVVLKARPGTTCSLTHKPERTPPQFRSRPQTVSRSSRRGAGRMPREARVYPYFPGEGATALRRLVARAAAAPHIRTKTDVVVFAPM